MPQERRKAEFLAKAAEADKMASDAKDQQLRNSWMKIAQSYRELAAAVGSKL